MPYKSIPNPPPKDDPRFNDWVQLLWQRVTQDDITYTARAVITATTAAINTTEAIVVGGVTKARVYANTLRVGTTIRAVLRGSCTSTVANVSTFRVRLGAAGTIADTAIASADSGAAAAAGTDIPFTAEVTFTVRTVGAAGTISGVLTLSNSGATGISTAVHQTVAATVAGINSTVDNWLSITYQSAAVTTTSTFHDAFIEVVKP